MDREKKNGRRKGRKISGLAYLMFGDVSRKLFPGISESAIGKMVAGAYVSMFRPEEELCQLSRLAVSMRGVADILKKETTAAEKMAELDKTPDGRQWLEAFEKSKDPWFYVPAEAAGSIMREVGSTTWIFHTATSRVMWNGLKMGRPSNGPWTRSTRNGMKPLPNT